MKTRYATISELDVLALIRSDILDAETRHTNADTVEPENVDFCLGQLRGLEALLERFEGVIEARALLRELKVQPKVKESESKSELRVLEETPWAKQFKSESPSGYREALRRAGEPVSIYASNTTGEKLWVVALLDDFWMAGYRTKEEAENLVTQMGWELI